MGWLHLNKPDSERFRQAISEIEDGSPRAVVICGACFVEDHLTDLIKTRLKEHPKIMTGWRRLSSSLSAGASSLFPRMAAGLASGWLSGRGPRGHEHAMSPAKLKVSARARAIIDGLVRTGRGSDPQIAGAYVRLIAGIGGFYWVRIDGSRLLRGHNVDDAEPLQEKFTETMARAGEPPPKGKR